MRRLDAHGSVRDTHGYITAETAVVLPALVLVVCALLWGVGAVTAQLRCVDAARAGARALARGEPAGAGHTAAQSAAPRGSTVTLGRSEGMARVRVEAVVHPPGPLLSRLPGLNVAGEAVAAAEDADAP